MRSWVVLAEALKRGYDIEALDDGFTRFRISRDGVGCSFRYLPGYLTLVKRLGKDFDTIITKTAKKDYLQKSGLAVPTTYALEKKADDVPENVPYSVVVKPNRGSLSKDVAVDLKNAEQVLQAASVIEAGGGEILVESYHPGKDYRILVVDKKYVGCVERRPANVTGDGVHTIEQLVDLRNQESHRGLRKEIHTTTHKLVLDEVSDILLKEHGLTRSSIPEKGKMVFIQFKITAGLGADYVDCSYQVHETLRKQCERFAADHDLLLAGFDIITSDITKPLEETGGICNEWNPVPYIDLNENCNIGTPQPVSAHILDALEQQKVCTSDVPEV